MRWKSQCHKCPNEESSRRYRSFTHTHTHYIYHTHTHTHTHAHIYTYTHIHTHTHSQEVTLWVKPFWPTVER